MGCPFLQAGLHLGPNISLRLAHVGPQPVDLSLDLLQVSLDFAHHVLHLLGGPVYPLQLLGSCHALGPTLDHALPVLGHYPKKFLKTLPKYLHGPIYMLYLFSMGLLLLRYNPRNILGQFHNLGIALRKGPPRGLCQHPQALLLPHSTQLKLLQRLPLLEPLGLHQRYCQLLYIYAAGQVCYNPTKVDDGGLVQGLQEGQALQEL